MTLPPYSRQSNTRVYTDDVSGAPYFGLWKGVKFEPRSDDVFYQVSDYERLRPDLIAYRVYGTTDLTWAVLQRSGVLNPLDGAAPVDTPAKSPVLLGQDGRPCLRVETLSAGAHLDSGKRKGFTCRFVANANPALVDVEVYSGVSNLPDTGTAPIPPVEVLVGCSSEFASDNFWTYVVSQYVKFDWLLDVRDPAPPLPRLGVALLWGGSNASRTALRLPSLNQIQEKLA